MQTNIPLHPCVACRRRKVKCDRKQPCCSRCLITGDDCYQPEGHRAPRKTQRPPRNGALLNRIQQLESSLEEIKPLVLQSGRKKDEGKRKVSEHASTGHLISGEEQTRYISASSWVSLADRVFDLRTLLDDEASDEEHSINEAIPGQSSHSHDTATPLLMPSMQFLWATYLLNVDRVLKILHVPTTEKLIEAASLSAENTSPNVKCLLIAIQFAAVTSLTDTQCQHTMNMSREAILNILRIQIKEALDAANLVTSHSLMTLQAFVIFLVCNRRHEHPRVMWVSSGVVLRLAQSMGLHHDGASTRLSVFDSEMRRRLWWQIKMLDVACAEDGGFCPTYVYSEDTLLPLNIDDADISREITSRPSERVGFTEMTFSLVRFEICSRLHNFGFRDGRPSMGILTGDVERVQDQSAALLACQSFIHHKFLQHCSPTSLFQTTTLKTGTFMLSKLSLIIQCPLFQSTSPETISSDLRNTLFDLSCQIITSSHDMIDDEESAPWSWLLQTYVHWHPVAYLLSEICAGLEGEKMGRAWGIIDVAMRDFHGLSPKGNENLWRPLRGLFERAKSCTPWFAFAASSNISGGMDAQPEPIFDHDLYRAISGTDPVNEGDESLWNLNDGYDIQYTFDPTWWSDLELGSTDTTL